jgi:hypothetical protein
MSLRIRRGTDAQRALTSLDMGEIVYTTDTRQLYVGNGIDNGGVPIIRLGTGLAWADPECTTIIATGAALQVSADTTPTLGGNLTLGGYNITGTGNIGILGIVTVGDVVTNSITTFDTALGFEIYSKANNGIDLSVFNGTRLAQTTMLAGDNLGQFTIRGYNGTSYDSLSVALNGSLDATATVTDAFPKSLLRIFVGAGGENVVGASFNHLGVFNVPVSATTVYSVAGTPLPSAATVGEGARAFVSDATSNAFAAAYAGNGSFKIPVYSNGSSWFIG